MAKWVYGAAAALAAACLINAAPAAADIELKAGCDGKWVARENAGFATYMVCEREAPAQRRVGALRLRSHHPKRIAQAPAHRHVVTHVAHYSVAPVQVAAVAPAPPRRERENECVNLNCPQFILVGIGY